MTSRHGHHINTWASRQTMDITATNGHHVNIHMEITSTHGHHINTGASHGHHINTWASHQHTDMTSRHGHHINTQTSHHYVIIIIIIINPLTTRVVGAPQMVLQPVFSIFSYSLQCPLGLAELQGCPFPDVVFPPLPLSALSSSPFHCALQDGFGQT